jgi:aspartyl-tRNA(Asn)/glutamyl-tRNA(Gln) amidotransferase subunit A
VEPHPLAALRLGLPAQYMFDGLDPAVGAACETALRQLEAAGATITGIEFSEAKKREGFFPIVLAVELLASLGRERFERYRGRMDPLITARIARGVGVEARDYLRLLRRHDELRRIVEARMAGLHALVAPTVAILPVPVDELADVQHSLKLTMGITRNSQPVNLFGQCGVSIPVHHLGGTLPVGLQLAANPFAEPSVLGAALAVEQLIGMPAPADLAGFAQ